jgi:hypothetical protein
MYIDLIIWDDEDDPQGNVQHIAGSGDVTVEEVEEVLYDSDHPTEENRSTENPIVFGTTSTGRRIAVIFIIEDDPSLILIRPVTAYPVPEYGD